MVDLATLLSGDYDQAWLDGQVQVVSAMLTTTSSPPYTILTLVETLGPALTHTTTSVRLGGLTIITNILEKHTTILQKEDAGFLMMFYLDRLRDHHSLLPITLKGLAILVEVKDLSFEYLEKMLNSVFSEVMVQQQVVRDRSKVFTMLAALLKDREEDIKILATQFTVGFLQAFEGEKDPRNLLLIFSTISSMLAILPISHLAEDVFESLAVYFPVDFTPPSGLVGSVTKQQLVEGLREGLAHPQLAEWTIGLLLEKLESDLESAKVDSLQTLLELVKRCGETEGQGRDIWAREVEGVWAALKREAMGIRMQPSREVLELAGEAVREMSRMLGTVTGLATPDQEVAWSRWVDRVWDDCRVSLGQPSTRLMMVSGGVLAQVVKSGERQAGEVLSLAIPALYKTWEEHTGPDARRAVLDVTGGLLQAGCVAGVRLEKEWMDKMFTVYLSTIAAGGESGVVAGVTMARAAGVISEKQHQELATGLLEGVRKGEHGMGAALADLAYWNKSLVEKEVIGKLFDMESHGLSALCRLWEAGFYPVTVPSMVDKMVQGSITDEDSSMILRHLEDYSLTETDKQGIDPAALLLMLLQWDGCKDEKAGSVLAGLAELLSVDNCQQVGTVMARMDICQNMEIVTSVAGSVTAKVLMEWCELVDKIVNMENVDEKIWRLRASFVNKCPSLADRFVVPDEEVGWLCIGLARRGDGLSTPWLDRLVSQLSCPGYEGMKAAKMVGQLVGDCWWRQPVTGLLFRQRTWAYLQPKLITGQGNYLSAMVLLIPHLPRQILLPSLPSLLPLVIKALTSPATSHSALACLADITTSNPSMVSSHLVEVVHHCLDICKDSPLKSRILALTILASCTKVEGPTTVQLAPKVTKDLAIPLRDRKRVVRVEAARTRNMWFLVTQPS